MNRLRNFVYTINNYTEQDEKDLTVFFENYADYIIAGREVGIQGTPHLQGYCELPKQMSFNKLKKLFLPHKNPHIESRQGTQSQAIDYCKKDSDYFELGSKKNQGKRSDIELMLDLVRDEKVQAMRDIIPNCSGYQSIKVAEKLLSYYEDKRSSKPFVYYLYGASGLGKTRLAYNILGSECYSHSDTGKFFEGYDAHENVLFDDWRKDSFRFNFLLRLIDRYPITVEVKGASRQFKGTLIVITSDRSPWDVFSGTDLSQFIRRLDVIYKFVDWSGLVLPPTFE